MQRYLNRNGNSNVAYYEIGSTYIDVCFLELKRHIDIHTHRLDGIMWNK